MRSSLLYIIALIAVFANSSLAASSQRITSFTFTEDGSLSGADSPGAVDVVQDNNCDNDASTTDPEPFYDTIAKIKIRNSGNSEFTAKRFYYRVYTGTSYFKSKKFALLGSPLVAKGETATLYALLFRADTSSGFKYFSKQSTPIDSTLGIQNVTVYIDGVDGRGRKSTLSMTTVISFSDYNRCG